MGKISSSEMKQDISKSTSVSVTPKQIAQLVKLIMQFSSKIVSTPTNGIDDEIQWVLREMVECLNMDRCAIWEMRPDNSIQAQLIYSYCVSEFKDSLFIAPPWLINSLWGSESVCVSNVNELPKESSINKELQQRIGVKSFISVPYKAFGRIIYGIVFTCLRGERRFSSDLVFRLKLAGEIIASAIHRKQMEEKYESSLMEIQKTSGLFTFKEQYLQRDQKQDRAYCNIVGQSTGIKDVFSRMEQVAPTDSIVLILGETGTGKGIIARALHELSTRRNHTLVTVNCAALPSTLIESELFGREKGAFTGSDSRQIGRFELANDGTLILDEIAELSIELQAKLLRVIQEGEFERLGSPQTIKTDVRIIAMTSKDLKAEVQKGLFRQELYYRLNVFPIVIPPLRERCEDIPLLVDYFVRRFSRKMGKEIKTIPQNMMRMLSSYNWPGNVRQLEHLIEREVIMTKGSTLHLVEKLRDESLLTDDDLSVTNLAEVERRHILKVLEKTEGKISGSGGAATLLGLNSNTLRGRMRKLGISFRRGSSSEP